MNFAIVNYIGEEIAPLSPMINRTSMEIQEFLKKRNFGDKINELYIGFICVDPVFDQFFMPRKKYTKSKKMLEYDFKEDFDTFKDLEEDEARSRVLTGVLESIDDVLEMLDIKDFEVEAYKNDLKGFFKQKEWIR